MEANELQVSPEILNKYLIGFNFDVREKIIAAVIKSEVIQKAMIDSTVNKILRDFYIRTINKNIYDMIATCLDWKGVKKARAEKLIEIGDKTGMLITALNDITNIINEGAKHKDNIHQLKRS